MKLLLNGSSLIFCGVFMSELFIKNKTKKIVSPKCTFTKINQLQDEEVI